MSANRTHGRCHTCEVIWSWPTVKGSYRVSKGEAFCPKCGDELARTAAGLAKNIKVREGAPIGRVEAFKLRGQVVLKKKGPKVYEIVRVSFDALADRASATSGFAIARAKLGEAYEATAREALMRRVEESLTGPAAEEALRIMEKTGTEGTKRLVADIIGWAVGDIIASTKVA